MKKVLSIFLTAVILFSSSFQIISSAEDIKDNNFADLSERIYGGNENSYINYKNKYSKEKLFDKTIDKEINAEVKDSPYFFEITAEENALYSISTIYKSIDQKTSNIKFAMKIDGYYPFAEAETLELPKMWVDSDKVRTDGMGNEFAPEQKMYSDTFENLLRDLQGGTADEYLFYLSAGTHKFEISPILGSFYLEKIKLNSPAKAAQYVQPESEENFYKGDDVVIEGENAVLKNSYWLSSQSDTASSSITPSNAKKRLLNYIGGSNFSSTGDTVYWETPKIKAGYYQIGFTYLQNYVLGSSSYRSLKIDGKSPFSEAESIAFPYKNEWGGFTFKNNGKPYLIYLSEGKHIISLTVTLGEMSQIISLLREATQILSDLYIDITMITGENVDVYRDYDLFKQIPDMEERLNSSLSLLKSASSLLADCSGNSSGTYASSILSMMENIKQMLNNKFKAHRYKNIYYSSYTGLCSTLNEMKNMPLGIDKIILSSPKSDVKYLKSNFIEKIFFSIERIIYSFAGDYNGDHKDSDKDNHLVLWVNWGRDQAQILDSLIQTTFTSNNSTTVDVKVVNASMVQGVLSGNAPDLILQHSRTEPVNLAMRGVLYDLYQFDDCEDVLNRFHKGAEMPYKYKDGLYALPDTQNFFVMFYRKDILGKLGLKVPETWNEFSSIISLLARNNLDVYLPYTQITDMNMVNTGVGSLSLFPSLLFQNDLGIYSSDYKKTTLTSQEVISVFSDWTKFYTEKKIPVTMDFYNRFRTGTCPIGIAQYTTYTTLKAAASEIDGLWGVAPIPGTVKKDGTISHATSGGGTGCAILKSSKNPKLAWEFLKWWTDEKTQLSYSNNLESVLGSSGRVAVSNVGAFKEQSWENDDLSALLSAWDQIQEIPEVPGSYYTSRAIDHSFWNVVNSNETPKDMLLKWGADVDNEIERKWEQYENR